MPRNTESGSSDTGVVTRSSASLIKGNVIKHLQLTVPCSVKLDRLRQSSKKLVLKNGSGYYTLTRAESLSYRIEGIKVLRTRNRSMPTATQKRGKKMNRPDPRGKGFHHYSQSRESGFLETSPGDYHKQGRFDARYSGPYRSSGRDNRFEQRRHWSPRGNYGTRGRRDSYGRDYNNSGGPFGRRASSYPDESIGERRVTSPDGRYERVPRGDRDVSSGFQDRPGRYPDQRGEKRRHQSGSSIPETKKSLISTYRKTDVSCVQSNHTKSQNASQNEDSKQLKKEPKENVVNNERTIQNHTLNKDKSGSSATSQGLSNSDSGKATQRTPSETIKPSADKHKKKGVLTMSQQIESLQSKHPKANAVEIKEITAQKSDDVNVTSKTGNGGNAKGSPHRTEISVPNHIDSEKSSGKVTQASSSGETESAAASPRRMHSARKSAPTSSVSRMQKSDMLKKQALLRSQSSQSPPASTTTSTPTARMGLGDMKPCQNDTDQGGLLKMEGGKGVFEYTDDSLRVKEAFTPPRCEDIVVLSDTEDSVVDASSQDKGPNEESTGINRTAPQPSIDGSSSEGNQTTSSELESKVDDKASTERSVPVVTSCGEGALQNSQRPEQGVEDQEMASDEGAAISETVTSENQGTVKCDDLEKTPDVGKIKEKALLKIKENLKKNLIKGRISPQTSSPGSRPDSRSSSNGSPENSVDTANVISVIDQPNANKKDTDGTSIANSAPTENADTESHLPSGMPDCVPQVNGKEVCKEDIAKPSEPCPGDNKVANCIVIDMVDDIQQTSQSDILQCGETQTSQGSTEPVADDSVHICNSLLDDPKITSAPEKPENASSEMVQKPSALPEQSDEVPKNDDSSLPKFAGSFGNVEDLSDGSVDLGPHEPGDMDSIDDDLLLEDEPVIISEGYNPEPEKIDTSEIPESLDSEISELAIARVESQSEDVLHQVDSDQPPTSVKRTLTEDEEDAVEEPVCKKSRTETTDIIEGMESGGPEETADPDASKKPVIFTHNEWKEFAQSIKEKYEKLVQTFNQKTNVMYEAQACWQQETLSWKKSYEELERKYEHLLVQVKEKSTVEKQNAEVQTTFTHRTKLSRKKKEGTSQVPQEGVPQEEAMETEQGDTSSSDAPTSSGTPPQTTSDCEPSAASSRSNSTPALDTQASSNKPTNLESKRQVFRATLNKVMQSKKNLSGTSEGGTASNTSSGKTSLVGSTTSQAPGSQGELSKEQLGSSSGAIALEAPQTVTEEDSGKDSPMDTSQSVSETADTPSESQSVTTPTESVSTKGPNVAITASGTDIAASQKQETSSSKTTPFNTETSKLPSYSEAMSSQAIPSPSKPSNSTALPSKAQSETSEKTKVPSATHSTTLPESPKHPTGTASAKDPESSKDSSKTSGAETGKDSSGSKSATPVQVQAEPEIIDLTDDPDPPTVTVSKPSAPSPHKKQDAVPVGKHTTLTTRSPHALVNLPSVPSTSAVVSRAAAVSTVGSSIAAPTPSGTVCASANARQVKTVAQNPVLQNATQRSVQPVPQTRTGSTSGPTPSPKRTSPGVPQSISPQGNKQSTSAANPQLRNVNPPVVTTQIQGSNVRPQVVSLQHGQRQQIPAAGRGRPPTSQVIVSQTLVQQRPMPTSQHAATATLAGLQPVMASMQNQARMQGQVAIQQRLQQQQQQISLHMLQQGRHQLPGAAASAAALATRQPQPWLQQPRPQLQVTSTQQQSLQVCQQIQLPTSQIQVQMVRPHGASAPPTLTTSTLLSGTQMTLQKQQQQQLQIQAQERAHAAQAVAKAAREQREQREQEQHQQARMTAQRLQSSQLEQQQAQRAQIKKLQEEQSLVQTKAQQHQNKKRLIVSQIQRGEEFQRTLNSKLSKHSGMSRQVYLNCQKQLQDVQEQERKLRGELSLVEKSIEECRQKSNQLDQHLRLATGATSSRLSPQELQKHQLQQQQQQLSQQLAQRQIKQQRNQQLQHQQQQQQQQQQVQKQQDTTKTKHPAQLPDLTAVLDVSRATLFTPMPIKPVLEIKHSQEGIVLSWKADPDGGASKVDVKRYLLYAYQESESSTPSTDLWKKIGAVDALPLPMACTLTHFKAGSMYHFAVCAISKHGRPGAFSNIGSINLP